MIDTVAAQCFLITMVAAGLSDLFTMRVPHILPIALAACFPFAAAAANLDLAQVFAHVLASAAILITGFIVYITCGPRAFGAGDTKLAAGIGLWFGFSVELLRFAIEAALINLVITLAILAFRQLPLTTQLIEITWISRLHDHRRGIPAGIAIALSGLLNYTS